MVEKVLRLGLAVLIQYRRVTDSHPASHVAVAITRNAYLRRAVKTGTRNQKHHLQGSAIPAGYSHAHYASGVNN